MLSNGSHAQTHIASVSKEPGAYLLFTRRAGFAGENRPCLLHRETRSLPTVRKHPAGGSHYFRALPKKALGDLQIAWVRIEIIIEKKQNVAISSVVQDCIALPRKT